MSENFNISEYMTKGVENIIKNAIKATLRNPAESIFMAKFAASAKIASSKNRKFLLRSSRLFFAAKI